MTATTNSLMSGLGGYETAAQTAVVGVVAMVILKIEVRRRTAALGGDADAGWIAGPAKTAKKILTVCAPEVVGVLACLTLAVALRARGDISGPPGVGTEESWERIKNEWPLLLTADTLLAVQAMFRLVIFLSAALRQHSGGQSPLTDETAVMWLGAAIARAYLNWQCETYYLDGPVGGKLIVSIELLLLPLSLMLSWNAIKRSPFNSALIVLGAGFLASRNRLQFHGEANIDMLWALAHVFEALAAAVYFFRTLLAGLGDASVSFMMLLLPLQQSLSAYYFQYAFEPADQLVGAGIPFELLRVGAIMQVACYLGAAAVHFSEETAPPMRVF